MSQLVLFCCRYLYQLKKWSKLSSAAAQTTLTLSYFESANEATEGGQGDDGVAGKAVDQVM